ncbi:MAG: hypothetical protein GF411_12900 [Candidatus Lokiarchaeota archaeon]|nr:hypothetical protein [Candidatus Lokiarchaeota archaeon]
MDCRVCGMESHSCECPNMKGWSIAQWVLLGMEWGYKACEKGKNWQQANTEFRKIFKDIADEYTDNESQD